MTPVTPVASPKIFACEMAFCPVVASDQQKDEKDEVETVEDTAQEEETLEIAEVQEEIANQLHRQIKLGANPNHHAALGGTVQFRQNDTGHPGGIQREAAQKIWIRDTQILSMTGAALQRGDILIEDDKLAAIGTVDAQAAEGAVSTSYFSSFCWSSSANKAFPKALASKSSILSMASPVPISFTGKSNSERAEETAEEEIEETEEKVEEKPRKRGFFGWGGRKK